MMPQAPHECYAVLSPCVSQLGNSRVRFKDDLNQFGCRCFSTQKEKDSVQHSQLQNTHPAHVCHTNIHLPVLSFPSVGHNLRLLFSLTVPSPQVCPLQVSANPKYSGFSAVCVTKPFTCLVAPPSLSSEAGPHPTAVPGIALATRSR